MNNNSNLSAATEDLIAQQVSEWDLAAKNYAGLQSVLTRSFKFDGFRLLLQCNPERMASTAAKVDAQTIAQRPCFLCHANLPAQQRSLDFTALHHYKILVNPFPIFPKHLTIPDIQHTPQRIEGRVADMLLLAQALERYILFYNGPKSGASAPDHFHFQAGSKGMLPIEEEWSNFKGLLLKHQSDGIKEWHMDGYLRSVVVMQGNNTAALSQAVERRIASLPLSPQEEEPMLNLLASFEDNLWTVFLFPRKKHRPTQFYETGDQQIIFSPASVDMGGVMIAPRREDFDKMTSEQIIDMFGQIS